MTATEKHKENISLYLQLGGLDRLAKLHALPNLQNRARIQYLISQAPNPKGALKTDNQQPTTDTQQPTTNNQEPSKPKILGLIAEYPVELHESYRTAYENWIAVCSLKIQLNALPPKAEEKAFAIQTEMMAKMQIFDRCREALDYYKQFKRLLPTESKEDLTQLTPLELLKRKSNISGLISRRKVTIAKMESELPEPTDKLYRKKVTSINLKKEQLQEMILEEEKLIELISQ